MGLIYYSHFINCFLLIFKFFFLSFPLLFSCFVDFFVLIIPFPFPFV